MNKRSIIKGTVLLMAIAMCSCFGKKKEVSNVTGWAYNDKETGGFEVVKNYKQATPPGMVFIEGGTFTMGRTQEDIPGEWNNVPRRVTVSSFYMDQYEISNLNWNEYLHWMKLVMHNYPEVIQKATPDSTVWRTEMAYNEPYVEYYFTHVAYNDYPVVGVSWEQANDYCQWRTDRANELIMAKAGIITLPDFEGVKDNEDADEVRNNIVFNTRKYMMSSEYNPEEGKKPKLDLYGENRKVNMSDGLLFPDFRLPTEAEWEYAAYAVTAQDGEENSGEKKQFPWPGHQMRNPEKKFRGQMQANYVRGRGDMMGMGGKLNDKATITNRVDAYWPNEFGLYNMAGNVNEWVMDVYRTQTSEITSEYNSFRGNEYKAPLMTESTQEGNNVKVPVIDSLGRVKYVIPADRENLAEYTKYDVRNFGDGDARSSMNQDKWLTPVDPDAATKLMYDPDETNEGLLASKVSNRSRVYKGGSWKDRAYWLNPSTRRYLDQGKSTSDIGFRCAMTRLGGEEYEQ
ncbi:MAG: SUMF1/EgtB/PvdO family nonheme iron enzyme [Paludibacteraceae bacterium]|jgi:gliding motility-associated lipoprotein GldJ|nr:SUMF1/EgtB/PvdO family nonheme iron enzyme [Paludibacteraceae bacterium]